MGVKDINAMTPEGETALDLAIQSGNKAIAKLLENRGCKKSTQ
jgi:ankyrin repeat protein